METVSLKLDALQAHPSNPRSEAASAPCPTLLSSLKAGQHKPITVRSLSSDRYEILAGHRTVRAAQQLGMETIVATVVSLDDEAALRAVIADNTSSRALTTLGMAAALKALGADVPRLSKEKWEEIQTVTGLAKKTAQALLRIAALPAVWCEALEADEVAGAQGGVTAAKSHTLLSLKAGDNPLNPMPPCADLVAIARSSATAAAFKKAVQAESAGLGRVGEHAVEAEKGAEKPSKAETKASKAEKVAAVEDAVAAAPKAGADEEAAPVTKTERVKLDRLAANLEGMRFTPEADVVIARALRRHDGNALRVAGAIEVMMNLGVLKAK